MKFCIIAHQRSASTALCDAFENCTKYKCLYEPFNPEYKTWNNKEFDETINYENYFGKFMLYYSDITDHSIRIKTMDYCKDIPKIFIYRENYFDVAISIYTAKLTSCWQINHIKTKDSYLDMIKNHNIKIKDFKDNLYYAKFIIEKTLFECNDNRNLIEFKELCSGDIKDRTIDKIESIVNLKLDRNLFKACINKNNMNGPDFSKFYKNYEYIKEKFYA